MVDMVVLKEWLKIPTADNSEDVLLGALEQRAVAFLERQTGYHYGTAGEYVETVMGDGTRTLYLSRTVSADPSEVLEIAEVGDAGTEITAAASDGWVRRGNTLVRKAAGVWTSGTEYQITYDAGYADGEAPGEVQQTVIELVALAYRERGHEGVQSEAISGYSYSRADVESLSLIAQSVLENKRPILA